MTTPRSSLRDGLSQAAQTEHPEVRGAERRGRAGAGGRVRVDRHRVARHRRPRQGRWRPGCQGGVFRRRERSGSSTRRDAVKASTNNDAFTRSSTRWSRPRTSLRTSSPTGTRCFNEKTYKMLVNMGQKERADRCSTTSPTSTPDDDPLGSGGQPAGLHGRVQRGVRRVDGPESASALATPAESRRRRVGLGRCPRRSGGRSVRRVRPRDRSLRCRSSLVPLGLIVCYSFWKIVNYNVVHHWTIDNYHYFLSVPMCTGRVLVSTVWVSVAGDRDDDRDRVPVRVLARALRTEATPEDPARARDPAVLDELPAARLRLAPILGPKGVINRVLQGSGSQPSAGLVLPLRPAGGDPRARLPLLPVRRADAVRVARAIRLEPVPGGDGPRSDSR